MTDIPVFLYADDPVCRAGLHTLLGHADGIRLTAQVDIDAATVAVLFVDRVEEDSLRVTRAIQRDGCPRVVLVVTDVDSDGVTLAAECGITGLIRRSEATSERLTAVVRSADSGNGYLPPDLLGGLLRRIHTAQNAGEPLRGQHRPRLSDRESTVLQMVSDGCETREIAHRMAYSERTVKNVIQDIVQRFGVRNRPHAVAYAVRNGLL